MRFFSFGFMFLAVIVGGLGFANSESTHFLEHNEPYEFQAPTGKNSATRNPMASLKTHLYQKDASNNQIFLLDRLSHLNQYPCTKCHTNRFPCSKCHTDKEIYTDAEFLDGKNKVPSKIVEHLSSPHKGIWKQHGRLNQVDCFLCHNTRAFNGFESINSKTVDINDAPTLCFQCHASQYRDWLGGAHGKRVGMWAKDRVILSCVECHNPHDPGSKPRFPIAKPVIDRRTLPKKGK